MAVAPHDLRRLLGSFASGVTVVTYPLPDGGAGGITVNAFTSVSLDPPLVLVSLHRASRANRHLPAAPFTVNILAAGQHDLALHFSGQLRRRLVEWCRDRPSPRLAGCLGYVDCVPWARSDGGDHVLHLGRVVDIGPGDGEPLVFYRGGFTGLDTSAGRVPARTPQGVPADDGPSRRCPAPNGGVP
ncbi:flavin reductase family protein [Micromonospora echinospora]